MQRALMILAFLPAVFSTSGFAAAQEEQKSLNPDTPEVDVCRSSGLIALKETTSDDQGRDDQSRQHPDLQDGQKDRR